MTSTRLLGLGASLGYFTLVCFSSALQSSTINDANLYVAQSEPRASFANVFHDSAVTLLHLMQRRTPETLKMRPGSVATIIDLGCEHACARTDHQFLEQCLNASTWPLNLASMSVSPPRGWHLACAQMFVKASSLTARLHGRTNLTSHKVPHLIGKNKWARTLREYGESRGCMKVSPATYDLKDTKDAAEVLSLPKELTQQMFFKPPGGSNGAGVQVTSLSHHRWQCGCEWAQPSFWLRRLCGRSWIDAAANCLSVCEEPSLAQLYVRNPWLLGGKKFDSRVYVFVASVSPLVVLMRPGFVKVSKTAYHLNSTDLLTHVVKDVADDQMLHHDTLLQDLINQHGKLEGESRFRQSVENQVAAVSHFLFANRGWFLKHLCNCTPPCQDCSGHGYYGVDLIASRSEVPAADVQWSIVDFTSRPAWRSKTWVSNDAYYAALEAMQSLFAGREGCHSGKRSVCPWSRRSKYVYWSEIINEYAAPHSEAILESARCRRPPNKSAAVPSDEPLAPQYDIVDHRSSTKTAVGVDPRAAVQMLKGAH